MSANLKTVRSFSFCISNMGSGLHRPQPPSLVLMELKLSGEASQTYLMFPSSKVRIRIFTLAEVSIKIHACSQVPSGFTSEETVEQPSFYPRAGITFTTAETSVM